MENPEKNTKILIVDDDEHICQLIALYLKHESFDTDYCHDGETALYKLANSVYDVVVLDVMMPEMDGFGVLTELRKFSAVPVIMLSARAESTDKITGLDCGADDYLAKPFEPQELIARIRAVLRRSKQAQAEDVMCVTLFNLTVDRTNYAVTVNGEKIDMTPKETDLLYMLAKTPMRVFTRDEILRSIWGQTYSGDSRTVDVHIKRIREKLGENPHWCLTTVWGVGYKIEVF